MNFNSDYQSNQNRICQSKLVNVSLDIEKTKTNSSHKNKFRILFEILFVITAVGLGYMQGLKSVTPYAKTHENRKPTVLHVIKAPVESVSQGVNQ